MKRQEKLCIASRIGETLFKSGVKCISIILVLCLTGCSNNYTATLVKCKQDEFDTYVYDQNGYYYIYNEDNNTITPIPDVGLPINPMLSVNYVNGDWLFIKTTVGCYVGDINDVEYYLTYLNTMGYLINYVTITDNYLECYCESDDINIRLIYTSDDIVRIYAKKSDGTYCDPPYINNKID